jgi:hypothetical protein
MLRAVAEAGYARVGFFPLDSKSSFPLLTQSAPTEMQEGSLRIGGFGSRDDVREDAGREARRYNCRHRNRICCFRRYLD